MDQNIQSNDQNSTIETSKPTSKTSQIIKNVQSRVVQHLSNNWNRVITLFGDESIYKRRISDTNDKDIQEQVDCFKHKIEMIANSKNNSDGHIEFKRMQAKLRSMKIHTNFAIMEILPNIIHCHANTELERNKMHDQKAFYSKSIQRRKSISECVSMNCNTAMLEKDETGSTALRWKPRRNSGVDFIRIRSESF